MISFWAQSHHTCPLPHYTQNDLSSISLKQQAHSHLTFPAVFFRGWFCLVEVVLVHVDLTEQAMPDSSLLSSDPLLSAHVALGDFRSILCTLLER